MQEFDADSRLTVMLTQVLSGTRRYGSRAFEQNISFIRAFVHGIALREGTSFDVCVFDYISALGLLIVVPY